MIPSTPGSGYVLFHHVMGECQGKRGVWAYVKGGMGKISEALAKSAESCGTSIFTDANVTEILVDEEGGKVTGVKMQDGTVFTAPIVCFTLLIIYYLLLQFRRIILLLLILLLL